MVTYMDIPDVITHSPCSEGMYVVQNEMGESVGSAVVPLCSLSLVIHIHRMPTARIVVYFSVPPIHPELLCVGFGRSRRNEYHVHS